MQNKKAILILLLLVLKMSIVHSKEIYVPSQFTSIQKAIELADTNDIVIVEPGIYKENLTITKAIVLTSKYYLKNDSSYIRRTIIDGSLKNSVITIKTSNSKSCKIIGLTLQNGKSNNLYKDRGLTLGGGGGIFIESSSPVLEHLVIRNNQSPFDGGGIFVKGIASPILKNVILKNNFADRNGGGFYCYNAVPVFQNCLIQNNKSNNSGAGCFFSISSPRMTYCTIVENASATNGGGINYYCNFSDSAFLNHVTIASNKADKKGGGILFTGQKGTDFPPVLVMNSIVWGNLSDNIAHDADYHVEISYSSTNTNNHQNEKLIYKEPIFYFDPLIDKNHQLLEGSPCIDAANIAIRPFNGKAPDVGAWESNFKTIANPLPTSDSIVTIPQTIADTVNTNIITQTIDTTINQQKKPKLDSISTTKPKPIKVYRKPFK